MAVVMTLASLAEMVGTSPSSVSRAMLGRPGVSEGLRSRIRKLAIDTGFRPHPGRQLARNQRLSYRRHGPRQLLLPLIAPLMRQLRTVKLSRRLH